MGFSGGSDGKESACSVGDLVQSLGWENPLEKGMATHSSILSWRIPWTIESMGSQRVNRTEWLSLSLSMWAGEPWGSSGRKEHLLSDCSHSPCWALRRIWKHRIMTPDSWGAYQRNDFSKPRHLHLPILRKALNYLRYLVFFNLQWSFDIQTTYPL